MIKQFCDSCGQEIPAGARVCACCGSELTVPEPEKPRKGDRIKWIVPIVCEAVLILVLLIILAGSMGKDTASAQPPQLSTQPSQTQPAVTDPPPVQTDPTDPEPTDPEPTDPKPSTPIVVRPPSAFTGLAPDEIFPFIHDNSYRPFPPEDLDLSECVLGWMYVLKLDTGELIQITDEHTDTYVCGRDCFYYVTNGNQLMKTDFDGKEHTPVASLEGEMITSLKIRNDTLYYIMDKQRLYMLDVTVNEVSYLFEHDNLSSAHMRADDEFICTVWHGEDQEQPEIIIRDGVAFVYDPCQDEP